MKPQANAPLLRCVTRLSVLLLLFTTLLGPTAAKASSPATVYTNDFEGAGSAEWSPAHTSVTPSGRGFLGEFGAEAVTLTLAGLPAHANVTLDFDFYAIQTWDGSQEFNGGQVGPDIFDVTVTNGPTLLHSTFSNTENDILPDGSTAPYPQSYPDPYPGPNHPPETGASEVDTLGYPWDGDSVYKLKFTFPHTKSTLKVSFTGIGLQDLADESWGLDNVVVQAGQQVIYWDNFEEQVEVGPVVAWGSNLFGESTIPNGLGNVLAITAGSIHSLALKVDGTVVAWGLNGTGQTDVPAGLKTVIAITGGADHNLALKDDGTVVAWGGYNGYGEIDIPKGLGHVTAVAAGAAHSLVLKRDGTVVAWGNNGHGQANVPTGLNTVIAISVGAAGEHNLALKGDGTVVAWGWNNYGQATVPVGLNHVTAIAAGYQHSLALKSDGTVVAWGANYTGQTAVPIGLNGVIAVAAGSWHSLALKSDGTVVAWGNNDYGQLLVPEGLQHVTAIAAGGTHNLALITSSVSENNLFVSSSSSGKAGDVKFRDEDIVAYDLATNTWQMVFDGSDVGVTKDVDAFAFRPDGTLLLSFNAPTNVPGLGQVDDSDIVQFSPTQLGSDTAGSFALYLRGVDVGLTTDGEDIDAIGFSADGHLIVSTIGDFTTPTLVGKDEDLIQLDDAGSGAWSLFLDGSTVGLANEDVNGFWLDTATGERYLTVKDSFAFSDGQATVQIDSDDIFVCTPTQAGCTYHRFWDSDDHKYGSENLDSIGLGALPASFVPSVQASAIASPTPDEQAADEDSDDLNLEELIQQQFVPWVVK